MKNFARIVSIVGLYMFCSIVWANEITGASRADFLTNELIIPCVQIVNSNDETLNNRFFDVILERRGNSFNYELISAESEDQAHCQRVADFAAFDDNAGTQPGTAKILVSCEQRIDRSKISVDGKDLASGDYSATVTSGDGSVSSSIKTTIGDEVEFDFDSSTDDIAQGATAISADFIQNGVVGAEIANANASTVVSVTDVLCSVRD